MTDKRGAVRFENIRKEYADSVAVDDLSIDIPPGEFFTLLGPSGSGKTTTLMMLAGFTAPTSGRIVVDGVDIARTPADKRDIGVVFQDYALFPHMTVRDNLAFPLEMRHRSKDDIAERVERALSLVDLPQAADRYPDQLSGGQKQRIAVARSIVFDPAFLLMDEPLGALDRKLRQRLQIELRELQRQLDITMIYVTHDQEEAMSMSDRVAVMRGGRIEQMGSPRDLYENPASSFVADFLGTNNLVEVQTVDGTSAQLAAGAVDLPDEYRHGADTAVVAIRPERLALTDAAAQVPAGYASCAATVAEKLYLGSHTMYAVDSAVFGDVRVQMQHDDGEHLHEVGDDVTLIWRTRDVKAFPPLV
jgi:putative spermidine/putrescine transport system ATP-binding protein